MADSETTETVYPQALSPTIWRISWISLLTDISSEMLYPIMPLYLRLIGFSALAIGLLEGLAEALAGLSKGYFGLRSDQRGERVPYIRRGYFISSLSKPILALFTFPGWVFVARLLDRLGKGVRSAPRDALLTLESTPENKARVFGLHRGMDTLGAVFGPLIALIFLAIWPGQYRILFILAFLPALAGVWLTFQLKEPSKPAVTKPILQIKQNYFAYWKSAPVAYRQASLALLAFTFFNSSDAFLLLRAREQGLSESWVLGLYLFYNLLYAMASFPAGMMADRFGPRRTLQLGLFVFALTYAGFSLGFDLPLAAALFALYALFAACYESIAKAWLSQLIPAQESGTALGLFLGLNSLVTLLASLWTGLLWDLSGPALPLGMSAVGALLVFILLGLFFPVYPPKPQLVPH